MREKIFEVIQMAGILALVLVLIIGHHAILAWQKLRGREVL